MIPKQLQKEEFRFCKIRRQTKMPFEPQWQVNGYKWNDPALQDWIDKGNNYGVIGGYGNLRILDSDSPEFAKEIKKKFPKTLTIKTGGGGYHFYFISDYNINHVFDKATGELRVHNYQVVGANSIHPNGKKYIIEEDEPLVEINSKELLNIIGDYIKKETKLNYDPKSPKDTSRSGKEFGEVIRLIREGLEQKDIYDQMMFYSKWYNSNQQYRDLTYSKALRIVKGDIKEEEIKELLLTAYTEILNLIQTYIDIDEKYKKIIAIWIIGTYFHKEFETYPYLFINAMKGSGKTRTLKLISSLIPNGKLIVSLNEAVLFRTAKKSSFCIDEFEGVGGKDKNALRELLNGAYKKGIGVERAKKIKIGNVEDYVIERHDVFTPIAMANIWGMENVLGDRCISVVIEKSARKDITKLCEDFSPSNPQIQKILTLLSVVSVVKIPIKNTYRNWNNYYLTYTHTTSTTHTTTTTLTTPLHTFYNKLINAKVDGRAFELFFPLYITTNLFDDMILEELIEISEEIVNEKKQEDMFLNEDMAFYDFISQKEQTLNYIPISTLLVEFRQYLQQESDETREWLNTKWIGRALKRLNLSLSKKRMSRGIEVILNITKAKTQVKYFKESTGNEGDKS